MDPVTLEYRRTLEECESNASDAFDKTAVSLAGGALGVSLVFLKDVAPNSPKWALLGLLAPAWLSLAATLLAVLLSLMSSMKSMRHEIECVDQRRTRNDGERSGGKWRKWTETFNHAALVTCISGIILLLVFVLVAVWSK